MTQDLPILETLLHPPLGALQRENIPGLFTGRNVLTRPASVLPPFNNVNAYGLTWDIFTIGAGWGFTLGDPRIYEPRLLQAATVHDDRLGHSIISEYHDFFAEGIYWLWNNPGPTSVIVNISPGVQLSLFWLVVNVPF